MKFWYGCKTGVKRGRAGLGQAGPAAQYKRASPQLAGIILGSHTPLLTSLAFSQLCSRWPVRLLTIGFPPLTSHWGRLVSAGERIIIVRRGICPLPHPPPRAVPSPPTTCCSLPTHQHVFLPTHQHVFLPIKHHTLFKPTTNNFEISNSFEIFFRASYGWP